MSFEPSTERAVRISSACSEPFACERFKLGRRSPGPVSDDEYLNLIITDPQAIDRRSGKLLPILLKQIDEKGVSVLRDGATNKEFEITYEQMKSGSDAKGKPRFWHGVCRFPARNLRYDGCQRRLGIYDTPLPDRRHHADIIAPPLDTRREREARQKRIIDEIGSSIIPVEKFRDGSLSRHARSEVS